MRHDEMTDEAAAILRGAEARADAGTIEWNTPIPLSGEPQPCPPSLLPGALGKFAESLSAHTETPRELAGLVCLAVTSAGVAGRCEIVVREGYSEPLNLFVAAALESGIRKSAVVNAARQPLIEFEREEQERVAPERRNAISERKTQEAQIDRLRKQVVTDPNDEAKAQLRGLEQSLIEIPELRRLWTQDCTPEALAVLTSKNGERMAVLSDEGGYFDILAGRYSRGVPNLDFVLQAHAGAPVRVDRKSGDSVFLSKPLLTIGLSPQPSVLSGLSNVPGFRGRGLLGRFMYGVPPSNLGYRHHQPRPIPVGIRRDWETLIRRLLKLPIRRGDDGLPEAIKLTFAPSAYDSWRDFQRMVEVEMREGNGLAGLRDWAGKLPGAAARIAGIFHCVTTVPTAAFEIHRDTAEAALALASILISHTTCAFGLMGANVHIDSAKRVVRWVTHRGESETTKRDIFCAFQSTFKSMENLEPVLRLLAEHHYLRVEERLTRGRPSQICRWNPAVVGGPR
jgi:hypothetical protein